MSLSRYRSKTSRPEVAIHPSPLNKQGGHLSWSLCSTDRRINIALSLQVSAFRPIPKKFSANAS